jgi:hypothetical protein
VRERAVEVPHQTRCLVDDQLTILPRKDAHPERRKVAGQRRGSRLGEANNGEVQQEAHVGGRP